MGLILNQIPGLTEAVSAAEAEEAAIRELPFIGERTDICGVPAKLFTLWHWMMLRAARSPFLGYGSTIDGSDVMQFLWIVSPEFVWGDTEKRDAFIAEIADALPYEDAVDGIREYLAESMMDLITRSHDSEAPVISLAASLIHRIAAAYGIGLNGFAAFRNEIIHMPLIELAQYRRAILMDAGQKFGNSLSGAARRHHVAKALATQKQVAHPSAPALDFQI